MRRLSLFAFILLILAGCGSSQEAGPASIDQPENNIGTADPGKITTAENSVALAGSENAAGAPVFIRIIKTFDGNRKYGQLELFTQSGSGEFALVKTYPVCIYSGSLGPKLKEGDFQSPEGFYFVRPGAMNPNSTYHLSFNLGFPNAYDRAHGRTGSFLMVHGECVSIGCYAMGNEAIEEIWDYMQAAFGKGQPIIRVHIFPFPMTDENLAKYADNPNQAFWQNLQEGWNWYENNKTPPNVTVDDKRYIFGAEPTP